jgi:tetratricopeptide (TPR) repeat protein
MTAMYVLARCLVLALTVLLASGTVASAQTVRAVLLPKSSVDGEVVPESGLDAAASGGLQQAGVRLVDLESTLRSQRGAFSDEVRAGRVPDELTVLNSDVVIALQLRCARSAEAVLQTSLLAQHCVLDTKVVSTNAGDVLFAESQQFTGHGLNAQMAVQSVLDKRVQEAVAQRAPAWLARITQPDSWEIDLTVSRVSDRETGRAIGKQLGRLPGVSGARLVAFDRNMAKYVLAGKGRAELESLASAIDDDPRLSLSVTYETARVLRAEFSFVKAYRQRIMAMSISPRGSELHSVAPEVVRAALMNLPYLEMAHTLPLSATLDNAQSLEARLRDMAKGLRVPLVLAASFAPENQAWTATLKLIEVASGRTLAAAAGSGETSTQALGTAIHAFDDNFRATLGQAAVRARLGLRDLASELASDARLVVQAFNVPTSGSAAAAPQGAISLRNDSARDIRGARVELALAGKSLGSHAVPDIAAHGSVTIQVPFDRQALAAPGDVSAIIRYPLGEEQARITAYAPRITSIAKSKGAPLPTGYADTYAQAVEKRDAGDWQQARALFQRSEKLFSNARSLLGLGMVELDLGDYPAAQKHLDAALQATEQPLTPDQRAEVRRLQARARAASQALLAARDQNHSEAND